MELAELISYAAKRYQIQEDHKWAEFPGFSVLVNPKTGKWAALLIRQWDGESGEEIQRCDIKCGREILDRLNKPYLGEPFRMKGEKWVGVTLGDETEADVVFDLFDRAISNEARGYTIILDRNAPSKAGDSPLPFADQARFPKSTSVPGRIRQMRRLYDYSRVTPESQAQNFYRQGVYMADYNDDAPWVGALNGSHPTYNVMNVPQLRGYFSWRKDIRSDIFRPIDGGAASVYIFELLNGIGVSTVEEALERLNAFQKNYVEAGLGYGQPLPDVKRLMTDLVVVNSLPEITARQYADPGLIRRDDALLTLREPEKHDDGEIFEALVCFCERMLNHSPVVTRDRERAVRLFGAVWRCADLFNDCFGEQITLPYYPFSGAVYRWKEFQQDHVYHLDPCRSYECRNRQWTVTAWQPLYFDREKFSGLLHQADLMFRLHLKTGRYLKARPEEAWAIPIVKRALTEAARAARPRPTFSPVGLDRIRREALDTERSLITEEEMYDDEPDTIGAPAARAEVEGPLCQWQTSLIRSLIEGRETASILKSARVTPDMAADAINEALYDAIGDNVLELEGDRLTLVEDYRDDLIRILGGQTQ